METDNSNRREHFKSKDRSEGETAKPPRLERLIRDGEWTRLDESPEFSQRTNERKIIDIREAIINRRHQIEGLFVDALNQSPKHATVILGKMQYLDEVRKALVPGYVEDLKNEQGLVTVKSIQKAVELKKAA